MDTALNLWPVCFIGLWAYPFIAIPYYRRRRLLIELAQIGHGEKIETLGQALTILRAFQARLRVEIEAEALSPTQAEGER